MRDPDKNERKERSHLLSIVRIIIEADMCVTQTRAFIRFIMKKKYIRADVSIIIAYILYH